MAGNETQRPHRRRWLIVLFALLVLGGVGALVLRHYAQPERMTALLIEQAHNLLGADLSIRGAAGFGFVPQVRVTLSQPALKAPGSGVAILSADALRAVVPWRTLWSGRYDIERIELIRPALDLDALSAWLAARAASTTAPPDVRFALHVEDGAITSAGKTIAQGVNMDFASAGDIAAWFARIRAQPGTGSLIPPLGGSVDAANIQIGATRLEGVHVDVRDDSPARAEPN